MNGKAIYTPAGKAGEYAKFACNFYTGCSNGCEYCYLKKGIGKKHLGGDTPTLKKCFRNEEHAIEVFFDELCDKSTGSPKPEIKQHGIFFTFTSDPCLPQTRVLTFAVINQTLALGVPVQILTKCTDWIDTEQGMGLLSNPAAEYRFAVGFTLTGRDDQEPNAAPHEERVRAMKRIHDMGILTFASVEPVIDIESSRRCVYDTIGYCDHYKIGLMSGKRDYDIVALAIFMDSTNALAREAGARVYWKESVRKFIGDRYFERFCFAPECVNSEYNIFHNRIEPVQEDTAGELCERLERINNQLLGEL